MEYLCGEITIKSQHKYKNSWTLLFMNVMSWTLYFQIWYSTEYLVFIGHFRVHYIIYIINPLSFCKWFLYSADSFICSAVLLVSSSPIFQFFDLFLILVEPFIEGLHLHLYIQKLPGFCFCLTSGSFRGSDFTLRPLTFWIDFSTRFKSDFMLHCGKLFIIKFKFIFAR